jgi:hypothetical protein
MRWNALCAVDIMAMSSRIREKGGASVRRHARIPPLWLQKVPGDYFVFLDGSHAICRLFSFTDSATLAFVHAG